MYMYLYIYVCIGRYTCVDSRRLGPRLGSFHPTIKSQRGKSIAAVKWKFRGDKSRISSCTLSYPTNPPPFPIFPLPGSPPTSLSSYTGVYISMRLIKFAVQITRATRIPLFRHARRRFIAFIAFRLITERGSCSFLDRKLWEWLVGMAKLKAMEGGTGKRERGTRRGKSREIERAKRPREKRKDTNFRVRRRHELGGGLTLSVTRLTRASKNIMRRMEDRITRCIDPTIRARYARSYRARGLMYMHVYRERVTLLREINRRSKQRRSF